MILKFVKLDYPQLIPKELIESVKGCTFTPEQFYRFQMGQQGNLCNHLYALIDASNKIQGFLWAQNNALDNTLFINTFSVSKQYWGKGEAIKLAIEFLKNLKETLSCPRAYWCTTNEKFFIKHGFKRSKNVLMEYNEIKENE